MKGQKLQIECGRCGETSLETLTEEEAKTIQDGIGPVYRHCDHCEKTTGWIESAAKPDSPEEVKQDMTVARPTGGRGNDGLVAHGQERLATVSERDEVNAMRHDSDTAQNAK